MSYTLEPCSGFKASVTLCSLFFIFYFLKAHWPLLRCPNTIKTRSKVPSLNFPKFKGWDSFSSYKRNLMCTVCGKIKVEEIRLNSIEVSTIHHFNKHNTNSKSRKKTKIQFLPFHFENFSLITMKRIQFLFLFILNLNKK